MGVDDDGEIIPAPCFLVTRGCSGVTRNAGDQGILFVAGCNAADIRHVYNGVNRERIRLENDLLRDAFAGCVLCSFPGFGHFLFRCFRIRLLHFWRRNFGCLCCQRFCAVDPEVHHGGIIRIRCADEADADLNGRGRLNLAVFSENLNIKQTGAGGYRHPDALFLRIAAGFRGRTVVEGFILLVSRKNFSDVQLCPVRDLRIFIVSNRDLPGVAPGVDDGFLNLCIRHLDQKLLTVLHGDRQGLLARKRLHADQRPVSGFHRLRVDFGDLLFCQLRAVFNFQFVGFLQRADSVFTFYLPDPYQFRTGEFDLLHIRDKAPGLVADFYIIQRQCMLALRLIFSRLHGNIGGISLCAVLCHTKDFHEFGKARKSASGKAELVHFAVHGVLKVHRIDDAIDRERFCREFDCGGAVLLQFSCICIHQLSLS